MFGAVVAASTSALPEVEEEERWLAIQRSRNIMTGKKRKRRRRRRRRRGGWLYREAETAS